MPNVRVAQPDETDAVFENLLPMHKETAVASLNKTKAYEEVDRLVKQGSVIVSEDSGGIRGSIGLYMPQWWYSDDTFLSDRWFFVHPAHRKGGHASRLIDGAKMAADALGVPLVLGVQTQVDPATKLKMFNRKMTLFGGAFIYGV